MASQTDKSGEFSGSISVVTGAASGIGWATTLALRREGSTVVAADIDERALARLADAAQTSGALHTQVLDVADWRQVEAFAARVIQTYGIPRHLVANAGINPIAQSSAEIDEAFWDAVLGVNLKGVFACCRGFLPAMASAKQGSVVNLASVSGLIGWGGSSAYCASKGGVIALTRYLAAEYASSGIRVNCVCPGSVRTPMVLNNLRRFDDADDRLSRTARLHPLGRIGEPDEIAAAILYLLSDRAAFITGAELRVDGGLTAI